MGDDDKGGEEGTCRTKFHDAHGIFAIGLLALLSGLDSGPSLSRVTLDE